jgi:hypothetical protein
MFYEKVKKFCFVVDYFIWIVIKKLLMWCKKCKKVRMFFIWFFFGRSEKGIKNLSMGCQTASLPDALSTIHFLFNCLFTKQF